MKTFLLAALIAVSAWKVAAQTNIKIEKTFHIQSSGGWDYLAVNKNLLYVSHGTQVNILDKSSGDSVGILPNTPGVHGIAFNNKMNKAYTSNGRANTVSVFDLNNNTLINTVSVGENPDAIFYEPVSNFIITCNGRSKDLSIIDVQKETVVATIPVGGKPETAVSNGRGQVFVNIEDKNEIVELDLKALKALNHYSLFPDEAPTGLAFDKNTNRLFSSCSDTKKLIVMDAATGKVIDRISIGDGCDGVGFDETRKIIFASNGEGTMTAVKQLNADKYIVASTVPTKRGARTIAVDDVTHTAYLPTADFEPAAPNTRTKMIAGTFSVFKIVF